MLLPWQINSSFEEEGDLFLGGKVSGWAGGTSPSKSGSQKPFSW